MRITKALFGLSHRVAYATVLGVATWFLWIIPVGQGLLTRRLQFAVCYTLDFPVAVASRLTSWRAIDLFFSPDRARHAEPFLWLWPHLQVAIPTYVILFYLPNVVLWAVRRFKKRKPKDGPPAAA